MAATKEYNYLQFPLCLLRETYDDPVHGINLMICYGIIYYALKQKYTLRDAARQMVYDWYRDRDKLDATTLKQINKAIDREEFYEDEDYNGFSGDTFEPDDNIDQMLSLFDKYPEVKNRAIFNYHLHTACQVLDIDVHSLADTFAMYREANKIKEAFEAEHGPDAMPHCKTDILFDFRGNPSEIDLFRAFIGCSSLIGQRVFTGTHKTVILSRMLGAKSNQVLNEFMDAKTIPTYEYYMNRKHFVKLMDRLAEHHFIMSLTRKHVGVIYISKWMEPEDLAERIVAAKDAKTAKNLKKRRNEAGSSI